MNDNTQWNNLAAATDFLNLDN